MESREWYRGNVNEDMYIRVSLYVYMYAIYRRAVNVRKRGLLLIDNSDDTHACRVGVDGRRRHSRRRDARMDIWLGIGFLGYSST